MPARPALFAPGRRPASQAHSSQRAARWGLVLGAVLALVTQAPAHWLGAVVAIWSQQRLQWQDTEGTVWQGSARWVLGTRALPGRVHWTLRPRLDLGLAWQLRADCCTPQPLQGQVQALWRGVRVTLDDHRSSWPATWLQGLGAPWNTVQPQGQLQLSTQQLRWQWQAGHAQLQGRADLSVQQFATQLSTLRPLGSYRVQVQGGDTIRLEVSTLEGPLRLSGQGQWQGQQLRFRGEASAQPEYEATLSNLLNVLGQRQGMKSVLEIGGSP
jgi:general secretion pathway protein N